MDIIAHKRNGVGVMYFICTLLGLMITGFGISAFPGGIIIVVMGLVVVGISGFIFIQFITLPYNVICADKEDNLHLPKGKVVSIKDVLDVSYRRATARGIQYKWGSVTLSTRIGTFKYGCISDCEDVAKRLTDMMYQARYAQDNS